MAIGELIGGAIAPDSDFDITGAVCRERRIVRITTSEQLKAQFNQGAGLNVDIDFSNVKVYEGSL